MDICIYVLLLVVEVVCIFSLTSHTYELCTRVLSSHRTRRDSGAVIMGRSPLLIVTGFLAQIVTDIMTCRVVITSWSLRSRSCYWDLVYMTRAIWGPLGVRVLDLSLKHASYLTLVDHLTLGFSVSSK